MSRPPHVCADLFPDVRGFLERLLGVVQTPQDHFSSFELEFAEIFKASRLAPSPQEPRFVHPMNGRELRNPETRRPFQNEVELRTTMKAFGVRPILTPAGDGRTIFVIAPSNVCTVFVLDSARGSELHGRDLPGACNGDLAAVAETLCDCMDTLCCVVGRRLHFVDLAAQSLGDISKFKFEKKRETCVLRVKWQSFFLQLTSFTIERWRGQYAYFFGKRKIWIQGTWKRRRAAAQSSGEAFEHTAKAKKCTYAWMEERLRELLRILTVRDFWTASRDGRPVQVRLGSVGLHKFLQ